MTRFHELDALRAFAMLLGVMLHASLFLVTKDWPVVAKEISPDLPYDDIVLAIHGFRMPVFFLLSGLFTALLWQRRGTHALIMHRLKRVGLPLLIGVFTIVPLQSLWWIFTHEREVDFAGVVWTVLLGWSWSLHHLWFLWVLLLLVGVFMGLISVYDKLLDRRFWWGLIPLVLVPQLLMTEQTWGPDTSAQLLVNPVVLAYYACFFIFGAFMYQVGVSVMRRWAVALVPVIPVFFVGLHFEFVDKGSVAHLVSSVLQILYAWAACFGLMGLFKIIASKDRFWVRYVSDASYWIYLWHLVLIYGAQWIAAEFTFNVHLEVALVIAVVTAALLVVYQYGVRYTWIGVLLNGPRARRVAAENVS